MQRLQKDLAQQAQINAIVLGRPARGNGLESISHLLKQSCTLEDLGLRLRTAASGKEFSLESSRILVDNATAEAAIQTAASTGLEVSPVYSYLANSIRAGEPESPLGDCCRRHPGGGAALGYRDQPLSASQIAVFG
jgi:hypothetical protein